MRNPWLCLTIVLSLAITAFAGVTGTVILAFYGKTVPESLIAATAACYGALSTFLVNPPRGSVGLGVENPPQAEPLQTR